MKNKTAIFLMGPTACGKTSLAIELAKKLPVEIINVDSAQVYVGMDIGTNKPSEIELLNYKHHLINICAPTEHYSVGKFCHDASIILEDIYSRGKIPLLVGGTMLYFYALCFGLAELPSFDLSIRDEINQQAKEKGWQYLHYQLTQIDPIAAEKISVNDGQRIQRALEVNYLSKKKFSDCLKNTTANRFIKNWNINYYAIIHKDRKILHKKIEDRFYQMLELGLKAEVKSLLDQNIPLELPAMRCVGYKQIIQYFINEMNEQEAYTRAVAATRQLAKKQYTWLKKWQNLVDLNLLYAECLEEYNLRLITRKIKC